MHVRFVRETVPFFRIVCDGRFGIGTSLSVGSSNRFNLKGKIMAPTISVVLPFYREGRLLEEAIQSVLVQTFRDFEIVLIDNNATPETREIAQFFAKSHSTIIRLIHETKQGIVSARNTGIRNSRGTFIATFDGDDIMKPERLERQFDAIRNRPDVVLVSCHHNIISADGTFLNKTLPELSYGPKEDREFKSIVKQLFEPFNFPHQNSFDLFSGSFLFFRKEDAFKVGLFDTRLNPYGKEDWLFSMCMFERGRLVLIPEPLQNFRHATAAMNSHKPKEKHTTRKLLQDQKLVGVLWERYGVRFPQNRKIFQKLIAYYLKDFGCNLMGFSGGKKVGRIFLKRALRQDLSNIDSWKYYLKSWAPSALHPRLFFFDKEKNDIPDFDSTFAQNYLKWPLTIPPYES